MIKKTILTATVAILTCGVALAQSQSFKLGQWTEIQNSILKELNRSYVDSLPVDRIERAGIDAMLGALDPYTIYIPEEDNEDLQMLMRQIRMGMSLSMSHIRTLLQRNTDSSAVMRYWRSTGSLPTVLPVRRLPTR